MKKALPFIIIGLILVAGLGFAAGLIGNKVSNEIGEELAEQSIENASGGNADVEVDSDGSVDITTDNGSASYGNNVSLPSGWPASVPTPASGTLVTSYSGTESGKTTHSVVYNVSGSANVAAKAYEDQLKSAGFDITISATTAANDATTTGIEAKKDSITVTVGGITSGTNSTLTIVAVQG